jgi:YVTN family beta-propeller protein
VIDLITKNITKSIPTGQGTNKMVIVGESLYVTNAGGWGTDNTVQVIDTNTDAIVKTIEVGDNPNSIVADASGTIWVAGPGEVVYDGWPNIDENATTSGFIAKIIDDEVEVIFSMPDKAKGPSDLEINSTGNNLYFDYLGAVYTLETAGIGSGSSIDIQQFIDKSFYGLDFDPSADNILGFEAPNFTSAGTMHRYDGTGSLIDSYEVGIGPNGAGL